MDFVSMLIAEEEEKPHPTAVMDDRKGPVVESTTADSVVTKSNEGCRVTGFADSARVPGVVRFSLVDEGGEKTFDPTLVNMSHSINQFWFGEKKLEPFMADYLLRYNQGGKGERSLKFVDDYHKDFVSTKQQLSYSHVVKVVQTWMEWARSGLRAHFYEMSVNTIQGKAPAESTAEVVFHYDISPLSVLIREEKESLFRFVVNLCAIVGGVFTVAGMCNSVIGSIAHKMQIGKFQ